MMNFRRTIQEIVGRRYRYALFYNFPGGLRFELSKGNSALDQALSALRRATAVCNDIFAGEEKILVHLESYAPQTRFSLRTMLRELKIAGITVPTVREFWIHEQEQADVADDDKEVALCCAFEVPAAKLQNLLWCAITTDLGPIYPKPRCRIYLLHPNKGIVVHPYDDRGMDVISLRPSDLSGLYELHKDLLLDYDIEAMRQMFASGGSPKIALQQKR
ncbi:MAG TPA: DUF3885 domain-containing protein [Telluria sp.]|jgi:hypothetical protein